jgi:zinc D-Ala-D-Ala carboxypeptidase
VRGWLGGVAGIMVLAGVGVGAGVHHYMSGNAPVVVEPANDTRQAVAPELQAPPTSTTTSTTAPTTTTTTPEVDSEALACSGETVVVDEHPEDDWETIVLDPRRGIDPDFRPSDIVSFSTSTTSRDILVREIVVDDLADLLEAAEDNNTPLVLVSGFRSYDRQGTLYAEGHEEMGDDADETIARPGHSEHQLGTAIDVLEPGMVDLTPEFAATGAGQWLTEHAHDYGFVVSYPAESRETSCYSFEPWHLRYVGRDVAAQIADSGMVPREWMLTFGPDA